MILSVFSRLSSRGYLGAELGRLLSLSDGVLGRNRISCFCPLHWSFILWSCQLCYAGECEKEAHKEGFEIYGNNIFLSCPFTSHSSSFWSSLFGRPFSFSFFSRGGKSWKCHFRFSAQTCSIRFFIQRIILSTVNSSYVYLNIAENSAIDRFQREAGKRIEEMPKMYHICAIYPEKF